MIDIIRAQAAEQAARLHAELEKHRADALAVPVLPPLTNRGGKSPVDNFGPQSNKRTKLDWYGFTVVREIRDLEAWVSCIFPEAVVIQHPKGIKGYPKSSGIYLNDALLGTIGFGMSHGRNMVNITGDGCKRIKPADYGFLVEATQALDGDLCDTSPLDERDRVKLIRLDFALDYYRAELTWDQADAAFDNGWFDSLHPLTGETISPLKTIISGRKNGVNLGRTLNAGARPAAVMCRVYEKGLEVFAKMPEEYQATQEDRGAAVLGAEQFAVPDTLAKDWVRVEVEFKPEGGRVLLDWNMIADRDRYFAGAFQFTGQLMRALDAEEGPLKVERVRDEAIVTMDRTVKAFRNSYGNTVHTLRALGLTDTQICDMVDSGMPNTKLLKAGVRDAVTNDSIWWARIGRAERV